MYLVIRRIVLALGGSLSLAAAVGLFALAPHTSAQTIPPVQPPTTIQGVSVVGQGIVLAQPDVARVTLGVDVFDQSLATAQSTAANNMAAVVSKLKADGIADSDIQTVSYNVAPQYDQGNNQNQPTLRGYDVQNMVQVRTTNVSGLGSLLDDVVSVGATRIFGINFEASDMESLKNQARDQAMANAQAKAQQLARDSNVTLGKVVAVDESDTSGVNPVQQNIAPRAAAAPVATTPIQPGQLQVSTTVHVVWSIQ
jgi:uncharacterized protein YggE